MQFKIFLELGLDVHDIFDKKKNALFNNLNVNQISIMYDCPLSMF